MIQGSVNSMCSGTKFNKSKGTFDGPYPESHIVKHTPYKHGGADRYMESLKLFLWPKGLVLISI